MPTRTLTLLLSAILLQAGAARADDALIDAAQREKERRAAQKGQKVKKFTDDDLKKLPSKGGPTPSPGATATPRDDSLGSVGGGDESDPEFWRPRVDEARTLLRAKEAAVHELEARIQERRAEFSGPGRATEPNRERRIANDISALAAELATARQAADEARESLEELLEAARRAGVAASQLD